MVGSPTPHRDEGFLPLHSNMEYIRGQPANDEHIVNIPLTPFMRNSSSGFQREGQSMSDYPHSPRESMEELPSDKTFRGRRRTTTYEGRILEEEGALTTMGKFYNKIWHFSVVTRYMVYILPLGLCFLVPILVSLYAAPTATIGGVRMLWFFTWVGSTR
jgi:hypothetical protein